MTISIVSILAEKMVGSEAFNGSFADAKEIAKRYVESGAADRVEILDEGGAPMFHYPEVTRDA